MLVRVKAGIKSFGWYGKRRRYPGQEFDLKDGDKLGAWMEPVSADAIEVAAPKKRGRPPKSQDLGAE